MTGTGLGWALCDLDYRVTYATILRGSADRTLYRPAMMRAKNIADASFAKVRADHSTETAEDYVEGISDIIHRQGECRVKNLALPMGFSHVTVVRTIALRGRGSVVVAVGGGTWGPDVSGMCPRAFPFTIYLYSTGRAPGPQWLLQ